MAGASPEKKGIADKVKGLLGGHGHKTDAAHHQPSVYGDATPATGTAESTRVGCLDKLKAKTGVGHGLAPEQTRAHGGVLPGHHNAGGYTDPSASPDFNGGTNVNSSAAVHGGWPHPINPNQTAGMGALSEPHHNHATHNHPTGLPNPFAGPQPTNPTGVTNSEGGAVLGDQHGNVYEGPRDDNEKKEGFVSKIMDKLHSPKGKPAHTTTTTPSQY
jgi:hypothetical protein